jgi:leucyl/phenylalanyl-tRNA--protein transferase
MPIEPRPPGWALPDVRAVPPGIEFVAVGADLTPGMLLAGYRTGLFAMPDEGLLGWWSPDPRGVLWPNGVHVARSLRRSLGRFTVSLDHCFDMVVEACADPLRPHGWISPEYRSAYAQLHRLGWAHSIEVWDDAGRLAGGLFGVEVGGLFAAESKFHAVRDASKVAVVALCERLAADPQPGRFIDVQWRTEHLASLGVVQVARIDYLAMLDRALALAPVLGLPPGDAGLAGSGVPPSRIRWRTG